jgi:subtilisin-like proprotein convertase family protein
MSKDDINQIVTEFKYGGSTATRLTVSYDLTSWLSIGQIAKFFVGGVSKSIAITSVVSDSSMITNSSGTLNLLISDGTGSNVPGPPLVSPALFVDLQFVPTLIEVVVNINHLYVGDLIINLVAPNGNVINLFNRHNGTGDNLTNTVFSSNLTLPSITTGTQPYTGTFKMNAVSGIITGGYTSNVTTLSGLMGGKTINGNWYLVVVDSDVSIFGTLVDWSLRFSGLRTTILLNETLTSTTTYESSKNVVIGATGMSIPWSVRNNLILTNNFDGSINSNAVLALGYTNSSAALLCDFYKSDGWGDWYLPSSYELVNAFDALASVGYVSGTDSVSGDYWTSTNTIFSNAFYVRTSGGSMSNLLVDGSKSSLKKVRAFRKVSILSNYKTWGSANSYDEPVEGWYTEAWDEKNWNNYPKLKTSNLIFDFRTDNLFCYTGRLGPYTTTAQSTVGGYTGTLKTGVTWSSDYNALSFNGTYSTTVLSNSYLVFSNYISPSPSSNITMEAWVYPTHNSQGTGGRPILSTNGWEASASALEFYPAYTGYSISLSSNNNTDTYNVLIGVGDGGGNGFQYRKSYSTGGRPVFRNKWNHIVVVMNGINVVQIYVNNLASPIEPPTGNQNIDGTATTVNTTLTGTKMLIGAGYGGIFSIFDGYIGAVRVYNTNLAVTDVKYNFEYDRVRYDV